MTSIEFAFLIKGMKTAYQRDSFLKDEDSYDVWFEMLKDIPFPVLSKAVEGYIKSEKFPPTIADIREKADILTGKHWSISFNKLRDGAMRRQVDYAGQYAYTTIGAEVFEKQSGDIRVMNEFRKLYCDFELFGREVKQDLFRSGFLVWKDGDKTRLEEACDGKGKDIH